MSAERAAASSILDVRGLGVTYRTQGRVVHAIQDASVTKSGDRRVVSKRLLFVEVDSTGAVRHLNYAPYLDYRPLKPGEPGLAEHAPAPRHRPDHEPVPGGQDLGVRPGLLSLRAGRVQSRIDPFQPFQRPTGGDS